MTVFSYNSAMSPSNIASITKDATEKPSFFIDFASGMISSSATLLTVSAVGISSTNTTITTQTVGTTAISGTLVRVDLKTGGSGGTGAATNGDQYQIAVSAQPSSGGPLDFSVFVKIEAPTYGPV